MSSPALKEEICVNHRTLWRQYASKNIYSLAFSTRSKQRGRNILYRKQEPLHRDQQVCGTLPKLLLRSIQIEPLPPLFWKHTAATEYFNFYPFELCEICYGKAVRSAHCASCASSISTTWSGDKNWVCRGMSSAHWMGLSSCHELPTQQSWDAHLGLEQSHRPFHRPNMTLQ